MLSVGKTKFLELVASAITSSATDLSPKRKTWLHNNNHEATGSILDTVSENGSHSSSAKFHKLILPEFTLDDVSYHDTPLDCWVIIYDQVYDITSFLEEVWFVGCIINLVCNNTMQVFHSLLNLLHLSSESFRPSCKFHELIDLLLFCTHNLAPRGRWGDDGVCRPWCNIGLQGCGSHKSCRGFFKTISCRRFGGRG